MENDCIFCKIAGGEIPAATIYEDAYFKVILDLGPATKGHALIIPKEHSTNIYDIADEVAEKVLPLAKRVIKAMTTILDCDGYNVVQNNGEVAGQSVFHFHMHLIPRYREDKVKLGWKMGALSEKDRDEIVQAMKEGDFA
jgi:Diadenosine tetraphosphate (Ap4A) hydrolase and other HIT family hydrolases